MKEKFEPRKWLNGSTTGGATQLSEDKAGMDRIYPVPSNDDTAADTELIISRIEQSHTDITAVYADWVNVGFALASEFGEAGREYYHRVSRFYPGYSLTDCNKQYDQCLKAKGHGITIKTLFHLAKQAGVEITQGARGRENGERRSKTGMAGVGEKAMERQGEGMMERDEMIFDTPRLPEEVYEHLPGLLKESADLFKDAIEKDVFLIGAIAVLSGCLPNIEGIYFDEPNTPHLYAFVTAPAGSGKGKMKWAKFFGQAIHQSLVEESYKARTAYEEELEHYHNLTKAQRRGRERPQEPPRKMFFIPANSSAAAFIQALADNNFCGVVFETEADTLADTFKQEWGNFSDVLRKGFHHESTSMVRRKDSQYIEIRNPHIAMALSGTPKQVHNMIPDVENGLFSRFLYYAFEDNREFKNPFVSHRPVNYTDFFNEKAAVVFELYSQLQQLKEKITFELTEEQGNRFTAVFGSMLDKNKLLLGRDFDANIKRLGLITFRIAMILSALRILEDGGYSVPLVCSDEDFQTAMTIATTLEKHAIVVFQNLPNNELKGIKLKFFEALPDMFDRQGYLKVARELSINDRTAEKYIGQFKGKLLNHEHNHYTKLL